MIIQLLEKLINKKFYHNKEDIQNKLDVFFVMNKITNEDYSNLTLKVEEVYKVIETEENTIKSIEEAQ